MTAPVDRATARALVDAGYMSLDRYLSRFGPAGGESYPARKSSAKAHALPTPLPHADLLAKRRQSRPAA